MEVDAFCPSTLSYKERTALKEQNSIAYARFYTTCAKDHVVSRLTKDASLRSSRRALTPTPRGMLFAEFPRGPFDSVDTLSGSFDATLTFRSGHMKTEQTAYNRHFGIKQTRPATSPAAFESTVPVDSLPPITLKHMKHVSKIDYYAAIRPDTQTTNQTLRMMGTYDRDHIHAEKLQNHIPSFSPGGAAWYHPDVVLTTAPTERRTRRC
eukprot:gene27167-2407_t